MAKINELERSVGGGFELPANSRTAGMLRNRRDSAGGVARRRVCDAGGQFESNSQPPPRCFRGENVHPGAGGARSRGSGAV